MIQIPYGLKEGKFVHISQVEKGLACEANCIDCGTPLEAHKGKTLHYFKHKNKTANCNTSLESLVHKLAKEIIKQNKKILLPPVTIGNKVLHPEKLIVVEKVELEHRLEGIVPDIICTINDRELMIEINVTHPVGLEKKKKIEQLGIATIEIKLDKELIFSNHIQIEQLIIFGVKNKKWIYNSYTIKYDKESNRYREYIITNSIIRPWIERGNFQVRQVHCRNNDFFDNLIRGYKADLYKNCKKCSFYNGQNNDGVLCGFGVDLKEFEYNDE